LPSRTKSTGGLGWYWHLVEQDLQDRGYDAVAVDLSALAEP
jgi:hypothetical protein